MWQGNWPPPHLSERPFRPCRAEFLPPHRLGGAHKRDALYSSNRAPFRNSRGCGRQRPQSRGRFRLSLLGKTSMGAPAPSVKSASRFPCPPVFGVGGKGKE